MKKQLEDLSKEELIALFKQREEQRDEKVVQLEDEVNYLKAQLAMYRRMQFGQKRERFEGDANQTALPFEAAQQEAEEQQQELKQK